MSKITKMIKHCGSKSGIIKFDDDSTLIVRMSKKDMKHLAWRVNAEFEYKPY